MWIYSQRSGLLWDDRGIQRAEGYSGYAKGKNEPKHEAVPNLGPIPRGLYVIGEPYDSKQVGPFSLRLTPSGHNAFGRTNFVIHGDSSNHPGEASRGCIVMPPYVRTFIHESTDKVLKVIE